MRVSAITVATASSTNCRLGQGCVRRYYWYYGRLMAGKKHVDPGKTLWSLPSRACSRLNLLGEAAVQRGVPEWYSRVGNRPWPLRFLTAYFSKS